METQIESKFKSCLLWDFPVDQLTIEQITLCSGERNGPSPPALSTSEEPSLTSTTDSDSDLSSSDDEQEALFTCHKCELAFEDMGSQRLHFQSDLHRNNVATIVPVAMNNRPDTDASFAWIDEDVRSLSLSAMEEAEAAVKKKPAASPFVSFRLLHLSRMCFKLYKHALPLSEPSTSLSPEELYKNLLYFRQKPQRIVYILLAGGSFTIAEYQNEKCLDHTSVKRYVTRRKQGGGQSAHDQKKHARSAGANLRRYNEAALIADVFRVLSSWSSKLSMADRILYFAPSRNKSTLFRHPSSPLLSQDGDRVRSIPLSVKKALFREIQRIHGLLFKVHAFVPPSPVESQVEPTPKPLPAAAISPPDLALEPVLAPEEEAQGSLLKKKKPTKKTKPPSASLPDFAELPPADPPTLPPPMFSRSTLDPDFAKRLEREKRALAAERRMQQVLTQTITSTPPTKPSASVCAQCQQIISKLPVKRHQNVFCSIPCASQWTK